MTWVRRWERQKLNIQLHVWHEHSHLRIHSHYASQIYVCMCCTWRTINTPRYSPQVPLHSLTHTEWSKTPFPYWKYPLVLMGCSKIHTVSINHTNVTSCYSCIFPQTIHFVTSYTWRHRILMAGNKMAEKTVSSVLDVRSFTGNFKSTVSNLVWPLIAIVDQQRCKLCTYRLVRWLQPVA